jgi:hypothetical protein
MKPLITRFVLPLSLIFFMVFTKWWQVETDLAVNYLYGFPLAYTAPCIGGGRCVQYFLLPLAVDLVVYFLVVLLFTWLIYRFHQLQIPSSIAYLLWAINVLYYIPSVAYKNAKADNQFYWQKEFTVFRVVHTGYFFIWEEDPIVDYSKYQSARNTSQPE